MSQPPLPEDTEKLFRQAVSLHGQGQLDQAARLYQQVLARQPRHVGALANLGQFWRQRSRVAEALQLYERALAVEPGNVELHFNRANALRELGQLEEAAAGYRSAINRRPDFFQAHFNLGHALRDLGQLAEAEASFRTTIHLKPDFALAHSNLGNVLRRLGRLDEAVACHRQALQLNPQHAESSFNLGNALLDQGQLEAACSAYQQAVARKPGEASWWLHLAQVLLQIGQCADALAAFQRVLALPPDRQRLRHALDTLDAGRFDPSAARQLRTRAHELQEKQQLAEAASTYQESLGLNPFSAEGWNSLGVVWQALGQVQAEEAFRTALELEPEHAAAHTNLGVWLNRLGKANEAAPYLERATRLQPGFTLALMNLADFYTAVYRLHDAANLCRRVLAREPDHASAMLILGNAIRDQGLLDEAEACFQKVQRLQPASQAGWANYLFTMCYNDRHDAEWIAEQHRLHGNELLARHGAPAKLTGRDPEKRLRIGYLSADFRHHPVSFFFEPLLRHHDPACVESFCYANQVKTDELTGQLRALAQHWRTVTTLSDDQLAEQIRADGIDILVDLSGHTAQSRLPVLARRLAPVQAIYMGYPFSSGLAAVDYLLADAVASPPEYRHLYTEEVVCLPDGYLCFRPHPELPAVGPLPGRRSGRITFGSFNHVPKLTAATIALWARVLEAVPGSRLILMAGPFFDPAVCRRYHEQFAARGIDPERVQCRGPRPLADYLAAYQEIDLALDPTPYNGGTTTCEALLMGVPVLTLSGQALFGRMGTSILTSLGMPEWIAATPEEYVAKAADWSRNLERLAELRAGLRQRFLMSPLGDGPGLARKIETAYRTMWRRACGTSD